MSIFINFYINSICQGKIIIEGIDPNNASNLLESHASSSSEMQLISPLPSPTVLDETDVSHLGIAATRCPLCAFQFND